MAAEEDLFERFLENEGESFEAHLPEVETAFECDGLIYAYGDIGNKLVLEYSKSFKPASGVELYNFHKVLGVTLGLAEQQLIHFHDDIAYGNFWNNVISHSDMLFYQQTVGGQGGIAAAKAKMQKEFGLPSGSNVAEAVLAVRNIDRYIDQFGSGDIENPAEVYESAARIVDITSHS